MSNKYKHGDRVPSNVLCNRLDELAEFVTKGPDAVRREFTMRVPAELDRDADLVISEASRRIKELEAALHPSLPQDVEEWMAKNKLWSITAREFSITTRSIRAFLAGKVLVPMEFLEVMQELVSAMREYEMDVGEPAPYKHRKMMRRAEAILTASKEQKHEQ